MAPAVARSGVTANPVDRCPGPSDDRVVPDRPHRRSPWWRTSGAAPSTLDCTLAWAAGGPEDAPLTLVCCNGLGVSTFFWDHIGTYFSDRHRIVVWDYPGHGASDRPRDPALATMSGLADDLAAVMDAAAVNDAVLLGHSLGCQVILEAYRRHPNRVRGLIPILGAPGRPAETLFHPRFGRWIYRLAYELGTRVPSVIEVGLESMLPRKELWPVVRLSGLVHPDLCSREEIQPYLDHMSHQDVRVFVEMLRAAQEHDASDMLATIRVPTLVIAGERDVFTPRHLSVQMAGRIPNAEMLEIPRGSHAALVEQPELINLRIEKFLNAHFTTRSIPS